LFNNLGEILGKLHTISFNSFQEHIYNIGKISEINWLEHINSEFKMESQGASRKKLGYDIEIKTFLKDNISLLEEENEPVVLHNDFQWANLIVKDSPNKIQVNGIIDFDNWRVGVRAQDFVKMEFYTLKPINSIDIRESFYNGYKKNCNIGQDFFKKIDIYSLLWFLKNYNSLFDNLANLKSSILFNERDKLINSYIKEIERIINS
jgi:Ser/Thr protein kinase RdoA (MazF antagonist)